MLHNKVIIVTGSTTGIGEAIARRCVNQGAKVLIHGLEKDDAYRIARELGPSAAAHVDDIADPSAPSRLIGATLDHFGKIDGLVNNAAWIVRSDIYTTDAALFDRCMAVNVRAPMLMIQAALPYLKKAEGSILNISSINAYTGEPRQLAYSISKAGLTTMSRNLANALGRDKVRVTCFNMGWVLSPNEYKLKISEGLAPGWSDHPDLEFVPSGKMTSPDDVSRQAVFWLSDHSRPFTGSVIDLEQYPVIGRNPLKEGPKV